MTSLLNTTSIANFWQTVLAFFTSNSFPDSLLRISSSGLSESLAVGLDGEGVLLYVWCRPNGSGPWFAVMFVASDLH